MALVELALLLSLILVVTISILPGRLEFTIASIQHSPWYAIQGLGIQTLLYGLPIYGSLRLASCIRS
jgi:hypothetical protein